MKRWLAILVLAGVVAAAAAWKWRQPPPIDAAPGKPFELLAGQHARIAALGWDLGVTGIEDSRCPVDVQCVAAGWIEVACAVSAGGQPPVAVTIKTAPVGQSGDPTTSLAVLGHTLTLLAVEPRTRFTDKQRPLKRATLRVD